MAEYALSWWRNDFWAEKLHKPVGRGVSPYRTVDFEAQKKVADHINALNPDIDAKVEKV